MREALIMSTESKDNYYVNLLTPEQHSIVNETLAILEKKLKFNSLCIADNRLLTGIRCYNLCCELGSFDEATTSLYKKYRTSYAGCLVGLKYYLFHRLLGFNLNEAPITDTEAKTEVNS